MLTDYVFGNDIKNKISDKFFSSRLLWLCEYSWSAYGRMSGMNALTILARTKLFKIDHRTCVACTDYKVLDWFINLCQWEFCQVSKHDKYRHLSFESNELYLRSFTPVNWFGPKQRILILNAYFVDPGFDSFNFLCSFKHLWQAFCPRLV